MTMQISQKAVDVSYSVKFSYDRQIHPLAIGFQISATKN